MKTEERWVYVGDGAGSYSQVTNMEMVGHGRGECEKEQLTTVGGWRVRACCVVFGCILFLLAVLLPFGFLNNWWSVNFDVPQLPECLPAIPGQGGCRVTEPAPELLCPWLHPVL